MSRKILNVATFGLSGLLLGKKKKKAEPTPEVTPPTMPLPDDEAIARARKEAILRQRARGGRSSTILTDDDTLGGY